MVELAGFSNWVLALLPRLFLYPGGVWLLAGVLALQLTHPASLRNLPGDFLRAFQQANLPSLAVGWAAVALLPLPGAAPLSSPPDRLVLVALPLIALLLDRDHIDSVQLIGAITITVALLVHLANGTALAADVSWTPVNVLASFGALLALLACSSKTARDLSGAARWLAWLGSALQPFWSQPLLALPGFLSASAIYLAAIVLAIILSRLMPHREAARWLLPASGVLTGAALLLSLLT